MVPGRSRPGSPPLLAASAASNSPVWAQLYLLSPSSASVSQPSPSLVLSPLSRGAQPGSLPVRYARSPSPLRPVPAPAPARPASRPSEATSVLNPKSCQLNRSLRLRRLLLTLGEPGEARRGEARRPPTRVGCGEAMSAPAAPAVCQSAHSQVNLQGPSAARPNLSPIQPRAQSTHLLQDPPAGALCTAPPSHDPPPAPRTPSWAPRTPHPTPKTPNCAQAGLSRSGSGTPTLRFPGPQPFKRAPKHLGASPARAPPPAAPSARRSSVSPPAALTPQQPQRRRRGNREGAH